MKRRLLFYSIAPLAVIALIVVVISSTTEIRPTPKAAQQVSAEVSTTPETPTEATTVNKKTCGCCADRLARLQEQLRKARKRRQAKQAETKAKELISPQTPVRVSSSPQQRIPLRVSGGMWAKPRFTRTPRGKAGAQLLY